MNRNFLNNQNYILGKLEKKKLVSKFFIEKELKRIKNNFKGILKWSYKNQFLLFIIITLGLIIVFLGTNYFFLLIFSIIIGLIGGSPIIFLMIWLLSNFADLLKEKKVIEINSLKSFLIFKRITKIKIYFSYYIIIFGFFIYCVYIFFVKKILINLIYSLNLQQYWGLEHLNELLILIIVLFILSFFKVILFKSKKIIDIISRILIKIFSKKIRKIIFFTFYINYFSLFALPFLFIYFFGYIILTIIFSFIIINKKGGIMIRKLRIDSKLFESFRYFKNNELSNKYYFIKINNGIVKKIYRIKGKIIESIKKLLILYFIFSLFFFFYTYYKLINGNIENQLLYLYNPIIKVNLGLFND